MQWVLIEPMDGGQQEVTTALNFSMWGKVKGPDGKPLEDIRTTYAGKRWRIVERADDPKKLKATITGPASATSLPIPVLPPEAIKVVEPAPMPTLPQELDPSGQPVNAVVLPPIPKPEPVETVEDRAPVSLDKKTIGRPKKVTA